MYQILRADEIGNAFDDFTGRHVTSIVLHFAVTTLLRRLIHATNSLESISYKLIVLLYHTSKHTTAPWISQ
jgi:nitrogen fixation protein FixH